jgi:hypothetical protein
MNMTKTISPEQIDRIAQVAHAAIRAHGIAHGRKPGPEWDDAEEWMRESSRDAVRVALEDPTPGTQHTRWMEERKGQGWTYGPERDDEKKHNPNMVEYDELSLFEKQKDWIIIALAQALGGGGFE